MNTARKLTLWRPGRLALFPFPFAIALSFSLLEIVDHVMRPDRTHIEPSPMGSAGTCVVILLTMILQALWGIPTLLWLENEHRPLRAYAAVGLATAFALSLVFALTLRAPQFGETLLLMLSCALLFFGAPLVLGYLLAHSLGPRATPMA